MEAEKPESRQIFGIRIEEIVQATAREYGKQPEALRGRGRRGEQYFRTGGSKRINYNNPEFDKLIDEEQRTGDHKKRMAILHQAGRILMEDVPFAPLYTLAELYGVARNVIWKGSPDGKILASEMKIKG